MDTQISSALRRMLTAITIVLAMNASTNAGDASATTGSALDFTMKDIDGKDVALSSFKGKVILMVNVASKCGNTPQYQGLEETYQKYQARGLVIMGFPADNFGHQEPGTDAEIKSFCTSRYNVSFPMFSKISVKGEDQAPLYRYLTSQTTAPQPKGAVTWNFEKFLVARDGTVVARFAPKTQPQDQALIRSIDAELTKAAP